MNKRNFTSRLPCGPFAKRTFRTVRYQSLTVRYNSTSRIAYFYRLSTIDSMPLLPFVPRYRSFVCFTHVSLIAVIYVFSVVRPHFNVSPLFPLHRFYDISKTQISKKYQVLFIFPLFRFHRVDGIVLLKFFILNSTIV